MEVFLEFLFLFNLLTKRGFPRGAGDFAVEVFALLFFIAQLLPFKGRQFSKGNLVLNFDGGVGSQGIIFLADIGLVQSTLHFG